ncbi:MAG: ABC transporter permease [Hyphomicrobiales bacterium]
MNQDYIREPSAAPVVARNASSTRMTKAATAPWPGFFQPLWDLWHWRHVVHALVEASEKSTFNRMSLGIAWKYIEVFFFAFTYYFFVVILSHAEPSQGGHILAVIMSGLMIFEWIRKSMLSSCNVLLSHQGLAITTNTPIAVIIVLGFYHNTHASYPLWISALVVVGLVYGGFDYHILALPLILLVVGFCLFPVCVILAYLGAYFRDLGKVMEMVMRIALLLSPVMYEASRIPERLHIFLVLNPFATFIEDARAVMFSTSWPSLPPMLIAIAVSLVLWTCALMMLQRIGRKVVKVL